MGLIDPTFSVNNFNKPKNLTELETKVHNMLMLLYGKPGFFPTIPSIGMDIKKYLYMFSDEIDTNAIKNELARQCSEFIPDIKTGEFEVLKTTYQGQNLLIFQLPIITDSSKHSATIGITLNDRGELVYKFVENKSQSI